MRNTLLYTLALAALVGCNAQTIQTLSQSKDPGTRLLGHTLQATRSVNETPFEEEQAMGQNMAAMLLGADPLLKDAQVQAYVNRLGRWIALHSNRPDIPWRFGVLRSDDANAMALPGGYILISTGYLKRLSTEAELANVLAHEIAHVEGRHHLWAAKKGALGEIGKDLLTIGAQEAARRQTDADKRELITKGANASKGYLLEGFFQRGLDKKDEFKADRRGVVLAARAGFNPFAMAAVLQTLGQENPNDEAVSQWFKTHPTPADRLEELADAMGDRLDAFADGVNDSGTFHAILARLP